RAYKDRLIEYLERFIKDLTGIGGEIAELLVGLDPGGVDRLLELVARRDAEDAAPGPGAPEDFRERAFAAELASWHERWLGLRQWFISAPEHPSQAKLLRARARKAIPDLLAVVALLNERRAGRSDRTADFRELAVWFAQAPDEAAMHRLWQATFGLHSSRHLTLDADTATARAQKPVSPSTPWRQAPPLMISPRLRRTGSYERRGRPNRVLDRRRERLLLVERAAAEADQTAAARARLVSEHPIRLSDLGHLDRGAFALFLALLGQALSVQRPGDREIRTTTSDGSLEIRLAPLRGGAPVTITTDAGVFLGSDHLLQIVDLTATARRLVA
ncbi:MAG: TIGR02677 family protein, partial [Solirubrobacteraceae bacterium]